MTLLIEALREYAASFDETVYPTDIYCDLLNRVRDAQSSDELGSALQHLIAWKDGKLRRDAKGPHRAAGRRCYRVERTHPNTLGPRHETILKSQDFFTWASPIRKANHFDGALIEGIDEQFHLWSSIVMPVFVLHCLRPPIYPIVDQYVIVVFNLLQPPYATKYTPKRITIDAYEAYHLWWRQLMREAEIQPLHAELNELKEIDSGIWAMGKSIAAKARELGKLEEEDNEATTRRDSRTHLNASGAQKAHGGTDSKEFKVRAVKLWQGGHTQANAITTVAREMGIELKASYLRYPGSHFDRWRKQGFWKRSLDA